jgi:hypothetical protein
VRIHIRFSHMFRRQLVLLGVSRGGIQGDAIRDRLAGQAVEVVVAVSPAQDMFLSGRDHGFDRRAAVAREIGRVSVLADQGGGGIERGRAQDAVAAVVAQDRLQAVGAVNLREVSDLIIVVGGLAVALPLTSKVQKSDVTLSLYREDPIQRMKTQA